jgi:hypothetical protein
VVRLQLEYGEQIESVEQLARQSDVIVVGSVVGIGPVQGFADDGSGRLGLVDDVATARSDGRLPMLITTVRLRVHSVLGESDLLDVKSGEEISWRQPGGTWDLETQVVPGAAVPHVGTAQLVALGRLDAGDLGFVGAMAIADDGRLTFDDGGVDTDEGRLSVLDGTSVDAVASALSTIRVGRAATPQGDADH